MRVLAVERAVESGAVDFRGSRLRIEIQIEFQNRWAKLVPCLLSLHFVESLLRKAHLGPRGFGRTARPTVTVMAKDSKHRKDDVIPIQEGLAQRLRTAGAPLGKWGVLFPVPKSWRPAEMLRRDLEAAGIPVADDDGRVLDFHSLRHTFISNVLRSGASAAVVKSLARHSTLVLSVDTYGHLEDGEERLALQSLPDLDAAPVGEPLAATGTAASDEMQRPDLYSDLYSEGAEQCSPEQPDAAVWRRRRDLNPGWVAPRQFSKLLH